MSVGSVAPFAVREVDVWNAV